MAEQFEYGIRLSLGQLINTIQVSKYLSICGRHTNYKDYSGFTNLQSNNVVTYNNCIINLTPDI